jgi:hypothetical protein
LYVWRTDQNITASIASSTPTMNSNITLSYDVRGRAANQIDAGRLR